MGAAILELCQALGELYLETVSMWLPVYLCIITNLTFIDVGHQGFAWKIKDRLNFVSTVLSNVKQCFAAVSLSLKILHENKYPQSLKANVAELSERCINNWFLVTVKRRIVFAYEMGLPQFLHINLPHCDYWINKQETLGQRHLPYQDEQAAEQVCMFA